MVKKGLGKGSGSYQKKEDPRNLKRQPSEYETFLLELKARVPEGMFFLVYFSYFFFRIRS